jgi:hypothetical protein
LQTINYSKHNHNPLITINPISALSYLRDDCHKQAVTHIRESQRFESMHTLQRKNWPTRHVCFPRQSTYARRTLPVGGPHTWQPFTSHRQSYCSREKGLPTQSTAHRLTDLRVRTQFLSWANQWSSGECQTSINSRLLGLPGPYHWHAIGTFNTCSRGPTHRSLTNIGGATTMEVPAFHIPLFDLPNQLSPLFI